MHVRRVSEGGIGMDCALDHTIQGTHVVLYVKVASYSVRISLDSAALRSR